MVRDVCVRELISHEEGVNAVRLTYDGSFCLTASNDRTVKLWNPHRDDLSLNQPQQQSFSRFVGTSGQNINPTSSSSSSSSRSSVGDGMKRGLLIKTYGEVHGYEILDVAVFRDNSRFVSAGGDK